MEENKYYSVQEFAKEVGVSRQTIYNALSNKLSNYVVTCKGVKMLRTEALCEYNYTKDVQKLDIFDTNLDKQLDNFDTNLDKQLDNFDTNLDKQLYKILREELNHKNKLIDELQEALAKSREEIAEERRYSREQFDKIATLASQAQYLQLEQKTGRENDSVPIVEQPTEIQKEPREEKVDFGRNF